MRGIDRVAYINLGSKRGSAVMMDFLTLRSSHILMKLQRDKVNGLVPLDLALKAK